MSGGAGDDRFEFDSGQGGVPSQGSDVITDFVAGKASGDVIRLVGYRLGSFDGRFNSVKSHLSRIDADGDGARDDVLINLGTSGSIKLIDVALTSLTAGDFLLA